MLINEQKCLRGICGTQHHISRDPGGLSFTCISENAQKNLGKTCTSSRCTTCPSLFTVIGEKTWEQTPTGKRIFRSPAYPRTASNTHQRERMEVWKHRGEEEILAGLLPTPLSRAILQGTKQFGVGKFFPRESLKAVNEFPTIMVVWVVPRETHILPAEPWVPKRDLYDKWDKGKREKQIRFPRIKGIDSADCFRTLAESQPHKPLGVSLLSIFTHGLKVHKTPHTKPQLTSALSPDPCKKELPGAEARAGPVIIVLPAKS